MQVINELHIQTPLQEDTLLVENLIIPRLLSINIWSDKASSWVTSQMQNAKVSVDIHPGCLNCNFLITDYL